MGILSKLFGKKEKPQQDAFQLISLPIEDFIKDKDSHRVWNLTNVASMNMAEHLYDDAKKMLQAAMLLCYESESLGSDHEVTIFTQSALSKAFFKVGENDLAFENGLDVFLKSRRCFGTRHEYTTQLAWNTFYIKIQTQGFEEGQIFYQDHLNWLFHTDPGNLTQIQRDIQQELAEIVNPELQQISPANTSKPKRDISITPQKALNLGGQNFSNPNFTLGIHIEEFYCFFGEQMQIPMGNEGFSDHSLEVQERKMGIAKDILMDLEVDDDIIMALFHAEDSLKRAITDQSPLGIKAFIKESSEIADEINEVMIRIRSELDDATGHQYDLGIFIARTGFCARYILVLSEIYPEPYQTQYKEIYTAELIRAGTALGQLLVGVGDDFLNQMFEPIYIDRFITLIKIIAGKTNLKRSEVEEVNQIVEEVMALQGLM